MRAFRFSRAARSFRALAAGLLLAGLTAATGGGQASASTATPAVPATPATPAAPATPAIPAARATAAAPAASASTTLKKLLFAKHTFEVPQSWPVIAEALHPKTCVRFDQHVVYLGSPGANQSCPSWLFGTTEAVLIQTAPATEPRTSVENPVSREITVTAPGVRITATFDTNPNVIYTMLARAGLPAPQIELPNPALLDAAEGKPVPGADQSGQADPPTTVAVAAQKLSRAPAKHAKPAERAIKVRLPELPATVANFHGLGFDACAAPSAATMRAWQRHSPYGAIGIYIGGSDRACDQQNLTAGWVHREASDGWRFFPMYAGPQASFGELSSPASQGARAAADAVTQARQLGFGPRTPIYYDMEAYPAKETGKALSFLSSWTQALHRLGYQSGVYSSSDSGIINLARQYSKGRYTMPDAIYDALWNGSRNVSDTVYGRKSWPVSRRMHQFSGNDTQTYGGHTIDVDKDFLNIGLPVPGGTMQATQAVESSSVFYEGSDHHLWRKPRSGHGWGKAVDMGGDLSSAPSVVAIGRTDLDVFYRGHNGDLWLVRRTKTGWHTGQRIALMGDLGGAPQAVASPNGVIDIFWHGSHDVHLWHGQYSPGKGWSGPQRLGGDLAGTPSAVENRSGGIQVFWEGAGHARSLWHVTRRLGQGWSRPASLGMGPLGGAPRATALRNGAVDVVWRGSTSPHHVWSAFLQPGHRAQGPRNLGGSVASAPWPAAARSTARVFYRGTNGRLWEISYRKAGRWQSPVQLRLGKIATAPFAAAGMGTGPFEVFWKGVGRGLWATSNSGRSWSAPQSLGGHVR